MDFQAFDLVLGYLSGFVGLTLAVSLIAWPSRDKTTFWLGAIVSCLTSAVGLRAWAIESSAPKLLTFSYAIIALLPALMILFFEEKFIKSMSKVFKGEVLLFTLLFLATSQVAHSAVGYWWHLGLLLYLFGTAIYFTLLLFEEGSAIMAWATSLFAFVCLLITIAYSSDLIFIFGSVRTAATLAAYALLIFTHTLSQIYFADRPFSLRHEMKQFLAYGVFATLATGLLSLSGIMIITDIQFYSTAFLLFAFIMAFQTVFTQIVAAADISRRFYRGSKYDPDRKRV